jgi:hypothetical protein
MLPVRILLNTEIIQKQTESTHIWCISLVVIVRRGVVLNILAVSRNFGNSRSAIKKVEMTLTVMVLSHPSHNTNLGIAIPAFSTTMSSRERV